ncbi:myb-related transcription factor, partner of profilin-like [Ambystoma mexicanum]|uniref:myb-related transcription factor, partner of profilin-like n=1 Tax=Ambystoma mexicanum TaxID=8296 RepID=UPI0037E9A511
MPKAIKKVADRQRKEKFTNEELIMLMETLAANANVVFANDMRRETLIKKKVIWAEMAQKVSAVGTTTRTVKYCRKRWDGLRLRVRSILAANRNLAMATGGGGDSPIKLREWEETCASTIGVESIEGVRDMECGAPTTSDGGSQTDSDEQDTATQAPPAKKQARAKEPGNTASTSRGTGRSALLQMGKHSKPPTSPRREATAATIAAPTAVIPPTQKPLTEGTLSAANSSIGEAAATAPLSDVENTCDLAMQEHTSRPPQTRKASPRPPSLSSSHAQSGDETMAGCWSPQVPSPDGLPMTWPPSDSGRRRSQRWLASMSMRQTV